MASFKSELPNELIKSFENLSNNSEKMLGEMTRAGAEIVFDNVKTNIKSAFNDSSDIEEHLHLTKSYKTPSDDGINTKVIISGYMTNKQGKTVPAPLVAMAREYGTSRGEAKKPFFRKSFNKAQIESAMKRKQDEYLPKE